jgi:hypothetical protein
MKLLYVGKSYPNFVKEATRLGVTRNIPLKDLKKVAWGEEVLCAQFEWNGEHHEGTEKRPWKREGDAHLLCSFAVRNVLIKDPAISKALNQKIWEGDYIREVIEGGDVEVERACGSYTMGVGCVVTCDIETIYLLLREVEVELGKKAHVMIGGPVWEVFEAIKMKDAKFSRGLIDLNTGRPLDFDGSGFGIKDVRPLGFDADNLVTRIHKYDQVTSPKQMHDRGQVVSEG